MKCYQGFCNNGMSNRVRSWLSLKVLHKMQCVIFWGELWNGCFSDGNLWNSLVHSWCCCSRYQAVHALSLKEIRRMMFEFTVLVSRLISQSECTGFLAKFAIGWRMFLLDTVYSLQCHIFVEFELCETMKGHQFLNFWSLKVYAICSLTKKTVPAVL